MNSPLEQAVMSLLARIVDPVTQKDLLTIRSVESLAVEEGVLSLCLTLGYPGKAVREALVNEVGERLSELEGIERINIDAGWASPKPQNSGRQFVKGVKHIIAVASGKGGVGKSTTTVNLALAMQQLGARVGILDADIYGPSQPQMLGVADQKPELYDEKTMVPIKAHGVQAHSMGFLLSEKTPAIWRGPMATGALQQLLTQTAWDNLDYLFVDMPPGTGDIQLTLSQQVPVTGAVIVTTPQDIALLDAKKAIEMFTKVSIPVLGVVENMAVHTCEKCGYQSHIFGQGGGERIATDYQSILLGALPLDLSIRENTDGGTPSVVAEPEGDVTRIYQQIAQKTAAELWLQQLNSMPGPTIVISND